MRVLIIIPKCDIKPTRYPPYGALYIGTYLKQQGYEVKLYNLDILRPETKEVLEYIKRFNPDVIGFSAIVSNVYAYIKELSRQIKDTFPNLFMVLGGQLSNASEVVLLNTPIDVTVISEGEKTIINLLESVKSGSSLKEVKGIAYRNGGDIIYTAPVDLIKQIDELPFPDFELIDMKKHYVHTPTVGFRNYIPHIKDPRFREPKRQGQKAFTIMTGRGCHAKCTFCCRNMKGIRKHSSEYILDLIEMLKDKYNVGYFTFGDESFVSTKRWVLDFLVKMQKRKLDILFLVMGARVDTVDKELIYALKDSGCFMIEYGYETGSQRMLDMMEKRTTIAENYRTHLWTVEAGLYTVPANVINMPGETPETINDTIHFLKSLKMDVPQLIIKYAQAQPGTPLYEYALLTGLIHNVDKYLSNIYDVHPKEVKNAFDMEVLLNFSGYPMSEVLSWERRIRYEVVKDAIKRTKPRLTYLLFIIKSKLKRFIIKAEKNLGILRRPIRIFYPKLKRSSLVFYRKQDGRKDNIIKWDKNIENLNQIGLVGKETIVKIKKKNCTIKEGIKSPYNKHIDSCLDQIDGQYLIRYPSLREICQKIEVENSK